MGTCSLCIISESTALVASVFFLTAERLPRRFYPSQSHPAPGHRLQFQRVRCACRFPLIVWLFAASSLPNSTIIVNLDKHPAEMSNGRPESSGKRWEARARVDYPLHYLIWLREHKLLEEKLDLIGIDENSLNQVTLLTISEYFLAPNFMYVKKTFIDR